MANLSATPVGLQTLLDEVGANGPIPSFSWTDPQNCPMDIYLSYMAEILTQLTECEPQVAYESIVWPDDFCDLSVVVPKLRVKGSKPKELAVELKKTFPQTSLFGLPFDDGINLRVLFKSKCLARLLLPYIIDRGASYGASPPPTTHEPDAPKPPGNKIVVEFSSPNIGKEFDGNHLRSTIIGAFIASLYERMGWDVVRLNFLGDWGKNIGLLAIGWQRFGSEELFAQDPLKHLVDVYNQIDELVKPELEAAKEAAKKQREEGGEGALVETGPISAERNEFFKKMEDADPDALTLWQRFRDVSIEKYIDLYARLNVNFHEYSGESKVSPETIAEVESILKEKGVSEHDGEGWIIDFKKHESKLASGHVRFSNGTTTYLLRDIAAVVERDRKYGFDKMIYVVSAKQDTHFQQLFKALELMGYTELASKLQHFSFGRFQGASTTSGNLLGEVLEQCQASIKELLGADPEETKEFQGGDPKILGTLSATALMVQDLSLRRGGNLNFDVQKIVVTEGETGLNLQQWYAALSEKLQGATIPREELASADYTLFEQESYTDVLRILVQFPNIIKMAFKSLESSTILAYLFRITDLLPSVWNFEESEEGGESSSAQNVAELAFFECVRLVLGNGMRILGLLPLESSNGGSTSQVNGASETAHTFEVVVSAEAAGETPAASKEPKAEEASGEEVPAAKEENSGGGEEPKAEEAEEEIPATSEDSPARSEEPEAEEFKHEKDNHEESHVEKATEEVLAKNDENLTNTTDSAIKESKRLESNPEAEILGTNDVILATDAEPAMVKEIKHEESGPEKTKEILVPSDAHKPETTNAETSSHAVPPTHAIPTTLPLTAKYQLIFFVPVASLEACKTALFAAGAGRYPSGNYTQYCWTTVGQGQFLPGRSANPHIGMVGQLERTYEARVEVVCFGEEVARAAVKALKGAHPYEEVAYGVYRLEDF